MSAVLEVSVFLFIVFVALFRTSSWCISVKMIIYFFKFYFK